MTTLNAYAAEISPKIRKLNELNEALKGWKAEDIDVQAYVEEIKKFREAMNKVIEDKEGNLLREIADLKTDIKLAVEAATQLSEISAKDFKAYLVARAADKVEDIVAKGTLFKDLEEVLA